MPIAIYALTLGAFGIGVTEFVLMGLLMQVGTSLHVSIETAGSLISGYALGVAVGAPVLTMLTAGWPRKRTLIMLMLIFTIGNAACALAPSYGFLLMARVLTAFAHGTFFGVGAIVATKLVAPERSASALAMMFTGLTLANILGVPFGNWLGLQLGWRATFWAVTAIGGLALVVIAALVPADKEIPAPSNWRADIRALMRPQVLMSLAVTALGFAGLFTVFTYIEPILTQITGFGSAAVTPILLIFGAGLVAGNIAGGRLADKHLVPTVLGTLAALVAVLVILGFASQSKLAVVAVLALLGAASFATVSPLQIWLLRKAQGAGQGLASSMNIAAFNIGNALGAWLGGVVIQHGPGLGALPWVAALIPAAALVVAVVSLRLEASERRSALLNA